MQGDAITQDKFVSFSYNRSNLQDPYNILASSLSSVDGNISFKSPENVFHLIGVNNNTKYYFDLFSNGRWDTGFVRGQQQKSADFGGSGNFGPNAVPKPATMLLMGGALAAAGLARRRRQR